MIDQKWLRLNEKIQQIWLIILSLENDSLVFLELINILEILKSPLFPQSIKVKFQRKMFMLIQQLIASKLKTYPSSKSQITVLKERLLQDNKMKFSSKNHSRLLRTKKKRNHSQNMTILYQEEQPKIQTMLDVSVLINDKTFKFLEEWLQMRSNPIVQSLPLRLLKERSWKLSKFRNKFHQEDNLILIQQKMLILFNSLNSILISRNSH